MSTSDWSKAPPDPPLRQKIPLVKQFKNRFHPEDSPTQNFRGSIFKKQDYGYNKSKSSSDYCSSTLLPPLKRKYSMTSDSEEEGASDMWVLSLYFMGLLPSQLIVSNFGHFINLPFLFTNSFSVELKFNISYEESYYTTFTREFECKKF